MAQTPTPSPDEPLMQLKSRIEGRNADVSIYADRVEWDRRRLTGKASEMIPLKSITSVTVERDGLRQKLKVICGGNTIELRCGRGDADQAKKLLTDLMLDRHPSS